MTDIKMSKALSYVLRHDPASMGIVLDKQGWTSTEDLITAMGINGTAVTMANIEYIVENNDKQRFEFNEDRTKIRARQGHSVKVDLGLKSERPPEKLYHGTVEDKVTGIKSYGLLKMSRHHVHLSADTETASKVAGRRRSKSVIFEVNTAAMHADGIKFFKTENNVWLTDTVAPKYLKIYAQK